MKAISIIIITYNRPNDLLDLLKSIHNFTDKDIYLQEVIIYNNASTSSYEIVKNYINGTVGQTPFNFVQAPKNLGVSAGRNAAAKLSNAALLFFIDDDTVFTQKDVLKNIASIFDIKKLNSNAGIATIQIKYFDTNEQQVTAFPHKDYDKHKNAPFLKTSYYAGCAHIIKKTVFEKIGYLREDFFYGMEEYDFSYRAIEAGFTLIYNNSVTILHKESSLGRKPKKEVLKMMWLNKSKVAYNYLPIKYFYSTFFLWSLFYLVKSKGHIVGFVHGLLRLSKIHKTEKRKPLSQKSLSYLKDTNARLHY